MLPPFIRPPSAESHESIFFEGERSYRNLSGTSSSTMSMDDGSMTRNLSDQNSTQIQPSFMKNFDVDIVGHPQEFIPKFEQGKHPQWIQVYGTNQFVESTQTSQKSLAFWDYHAKAAFFYGFGYLRKNPLVKGQYCWTYDPEAEPFKVIQKKGKQQSIYNNHFWRTHIQFSSELNPFWLGNFHKIVHLPKTQYFLKYHNNWVQMYQIREFDRFDLLSNNTKQRFYFLSLCPPCTCYILLLLKYSFGNISKY